MLQGLTGQKAAMSSKTDHAAPRGTEVQGLVAQAQAGNVAAFERLIGMHQDKVYGFARAFTRDRDEACDLSQEALIKVYRSIGGFRHESSFSTWLFRVVKNVFLDHARSRQQRERTSEQPLEGAHERGPMGGGDGQDLGAEERLLQREAHAELWQALGRVPEAYRTVVVMADMQGFSYDEIAAVVEVPLGTVKSRLKRGRDALREELLGLRARQGDVSLPRPRKVGS